MGLWKMLAEEIQVIQKKDPARPSTLEVLLYPGFRAIINYRIAHQLYLKNHRFWARYLSERAKRKTGIEIHPGAQIGKNLFIDHGTGLVIGQTAIVGSDVTLYHGVTLGGTGKEQGKRHPTVEDDVMIGSGAKVLGNITIGQNSKIGANAVVLKNVASNTTVVGVPAKRVRRRKNEKK